MIKAIIKYNRALEALIIFSCGEEPRADESRKNNWLKRSFRREEGRIYCSFRDEAGLTSHDEAEKGGAIALTNRDYNEEVWGDSQLYG